MDSSPVVTIAVFGDINFHLPCTRRFPIYICGHIPSICNKEVYDVNKASYNKASRSTQPSIPPGSVNEYQLWLERQRQVWVIPLADERQVVQVKNCDIP